MRAKIGHLNKLTLNQLTPAKEKSTIWHCWILRNAQQKCSFHFTQKFLVNFQRLFHNVFMLGSRLPCVRSACSQFSKMNFWLALMILLNLYIRQRQLETEVCILNSQSQFCSITVFYSSWETIPQKARGFYELRTIRKNIILPGI